jgi:hypothetical protein
MSFGISIALRAIEVLFYSRTLGEILLARGQKLENLICG